MTKKELSACRWHCYNQKILQRQVDALKDALLRVTPVLNGMPHGGQRAGMDERVAALVDCERQLSASEREHADALARINTFISSLPADAAAIMRLRYAEGLEWWQIAREVNMSESSCYRIHKRALALLKIEST